MTAKEFYRSYQADSTVSPIAENMMTMINQDGCVHALDFGCGEGKHIRRLNAKGISTLGIDISILNVFKACVQSEGIALGDENYLRHFCNFDCVFCVSVLDHIPQVHAIVDEFKRIANKVVYLIETNDVVDNFYYQHDYEGMDFTKLESWRSDGDGALYNLYVWYKS